MATRYPFGGGVADYVIDTDTTFAAFLQPGASITASNAQNANSIANMVWLAAE